MKKKATGQQRIEHLSCKRRREEFDFFKCKERRLRQDATESDQGHKTKRVKLLS